MKSLILTFIVALLATTTTQAQWSGGSSTSNTTYRTGDVLIGTSFNRFNDELSIYDSGSPSMSITRGSSAGHLQMAVAGCTQCYSKLAYNANDVVLRANGINTGDLIISNQGSDDIVFTLGTAGNDSEYMRILAGSGKVRMSTGYMNTPGNYRLYVQHGILTEKVKVAVENSSAWADFVFDTNYELLPIEEVAFFVDENQHLPDVPSADEMVEDGLDVAQMDALLLQKIEELTLYIIDLNAELADLKRDIDVLKK